MFDTRLPQPEGGLRWVHLTPGPALVSPGLEPYAQHLVTTGSWTLGSRGPAESSLGWDEVARAMDVPLERLIRVRQVHGAAVLVCRAGRARSSETADADIIISNDPGVAVSVQAADCVALLAVDRRTGAVAAAHAGWRGLVADVPGRMIDALGREFDSRPEDLVVALGPSIGPCCYEVGADVRDHFLSVGVAEATVDRWFQVGPRPSARNPPMAGLSPVRAGHWYFDLWSVARDRLEAAGVPPNQILSPQLCTASHPELLCSYRRDGRQAGRIAAVIRAR